VPLHIVDGGQFFRALLGRFTIDGCVIGQQKASENFMKFNCLFSSPNGRQKYNMFALLFLHFSTACAAILFLYCYRYTTELQQRHHDALLIGSILAIITTSIIYRSIIFATISAATLIVLASMQLIWYQNYTAHGVSTRGNFFTNDGFFDSIIGIVLIAFSVSGIIAWIVSKTREPSPSSESTIVSSLCLFLIGGVIVFFIFLPHKRHSDLSQAWALQSPELLYLSSQRSNAILAQDHALSPIQQLTRGEIRIACFSARSLDGGSAEIDVTISNFDTKFAFSHVLTDKMAPVYIPIPQDRGPFNIDKHNALSITLHKSNSNIIEIEFLDSIIKFGPEMTAYSFDVFSGNQRFMGDIDGTRPLDKSPIIPEVKIPPCAPAAAK